MGSRTSNHGDSEESQRDKGTSGSDKPRGHQGEGVVDVEARGWDRIVTFMGPRPFCLHKKKKIFLIAFHNRIGIKMNIIQADGIHFISSDFKRNENFVGPKSVVGPRHCACCAYGISQPAEQWVGTQVRRL